MADYSGTIANVALADGDTIGSTNNLTISATLTCAAGATISVYAGRQIIDNTAGVSFTLVGTETAPITFKAQAADAINTSWAGFRESANNQVRDFQYIIFESGNYVYNFTTATGQTYTFNHIWLKNCARNFCNGTANALLTINLQNFLIEPSGGEYQENVAWNGATAIHSGFFTYGRDGLFYTTALNGSDTWTDSVWSCVARAIYKTAGYYTTLNVTDCYFSTQTHSLFTNQTNTQTWTVTRCVFNGKEGGNIAGIACQAANVTINSSYNDFTRLYYYGLVRTAGTLNSDYDYVAGCTTRQEDVVDAGANNQVSSLSSRTNIQSTPNKPLLVDNIAEGTPSADSITITFDSAAGETTYRRKGVGFIKYGTTSGVYTGYTPYPITGQQRGKIWMGWDTSQTFKTTGHSVTISNLKSGTTYYYKACFIDPLGMVAESSEGNFTTSWPTSPLPVFRP